MFRKLTITLMQFEPFALAIVEANDDA